MNKRHVADVFSEWAETGRADRMADGHLVNAERAFHILNPAPGSRYLDIGCGNGYSVRWAAGVDPSVQAMGLDTAEGMIRHARALSSQWSNCRFIHAPFPCPELRTGAFDSIFTMEVLYYMDDVPSALESIRSLLKPGGKVVSIIDYYEENPHSFGWPEDVGLAMQLHSIEGWRSLFEAAGLRVLQQEQLKHPLPEGQAPNWQHSIGSLMTLAIRD